MERITIPVIRQILPEILARDILSVQPMTDAGEIFMMNIRQRSVNVDRKVLLAALKKNLEIHRKDYEEALVECKARLEKDLAAALEKVKGITNPRKLQSWSFRFQYPQSHVRDYEDVIEMLEMSVDEIINLDQESFKAYIKNEWSWSAGFALTKSMYSTDGAFLGE